MDDKQGVVHDNTEAHRYEVKIDEHLAVLTYYRRGDTIVFLHTGVPPALEGHGIGNKLAYAALEDARVQKLTVVPDCPFVAAYIRRHQEYLSLLTASEQARLLQG